MDDALAGQDPPATLADKLELLLRRLSRDRGNRPTLKELARASSARGRGLSHQSVGDFLNGVKSNPTASTMTALARAFECPGPYLLDGWDDLTALAVFERSPTARETLRLVSDLDEEWLDALRGTALELRRRAGKEGTPPREVPEIDNPVEPLRRGRPRTRIRKRLSIAEAAERAAEDLEGP